ncbi:FAD:protein FMN transferase [Alkalilacustris brevis]|uniref:FAD:protein FMN transferase n=1 Tax=Alkalilacustris brevis TaxID=2026338 RepID=UPI000E0D8D96|nr:FAD:protein FMN transferase [Alkalilacustris brevis]
MPSGLSRRRFIGISAAGLASAAVGSRAGAGTASGRLYQWRGVAMGAGASITLADHPDAPRIALAARAEIDRLENIFSLHRPDSALMRLNAEGRLAAPPFELLECLSLCGAVHAASDGLFDPTVQPLWAAHAEAYARGAPPDADALRAARRKLGWAGLRIAPDELRVDRPGMALTLNGVAQGYVADRVAHLLEREGLRDILVNTGEFRALGGDPRGGAWRVTLDARPGQARKGVWATDATAKAPQERAGWLAAGPMDGPEETGGTAMEGGGAGADPLHQVGLRDRALASSAPLGTVFDSAGQAGHILDPRDGMPAKPRWDLVTVTAPSAALADALSTTFCLMERPDIARCLGAFPSARLAYLG